MQRKLLMSVLKFCYFASCFWFLFSQTAYAYIDPSAVTYVIQAVAAVLIAVGAAVTVFRHKIVALFKKDKQNDKTEIHVDDTVFEDLGDNEEK